MSFSIYMYALMLHKYLKMGLLGHRTFIHSALVDTAKVFQSDCTVLQSYQQCMGIPVVPYPYWHLVWSLFLAIDF